MIGQLPPVAPPAQPVALTAPPAPPVATTVQPAQPAPEPVAAVVTGANWAVLIPLIVTGLGVLLTQVFTFLTARANKKTTEAVAVVTDEQTHKLDRIEILVDGRYGEVLQELADVKRLLAAESGKPSDHDQADKAQARATEQNARVTSASPKREGARE